MGFRVGVGPRILRMHVGSRGVGVSSGVGPFSAYAGTTARQRRRSYASAGSSGTGTLFVLLAAVGLVVQFWWVILIVVGLIMLTAGVVALVTRDTARRLTLRERRDRRYGDEALDARRTEHLEREHVHAAEKTRLRQAADLDRVQRTQRAIWVRDVEAQRRAAWREEHGEPFVAPYRCRPASIVLWSASFFLLLTGNAVVAGSYIALSVAVLSMAVGAVAWGIYFWRGIPSRRTALLEDLAGEERRAFASLRRSRSGAIVLWVLSIIPLVFGVVGLSTPGASNAYIGACVVLLGLALVTAGLYVWRGPKVPSRRLRSLEAGLGNPIAATPGVHVHGNLTVGRLSRGN